MVVVARRAGVRCFVHLSAIGVQDDPRFPYLEYHEPKGIYVLEALANGTPVVQPSHGAFPELIEHTGGGLLVAPTNPAALASALETMHSDEALRLRCATSGHESVHQHFGAAAIAQASINLFSDSLKARVPPT